MISLNKYSSKFFSKEYDNGLEFSCGGTMWWYCFSTEVWTIPKSFRTKLQEEFVDFEGLRIAWIK